MQHRMLVVSVKPLFYIKYRSIMLCMAFLDLTKLYFRLLYQCSLCQRTFHKGKWLPILKLNFLTRLKE